MGMREEIQAELAEAFSDPDGLADAVKPVAGSRTIKGGYDPAIGGTAPATTIRYTGRGCSAATWPRKLMDHVSRLRT